MTSGSRRVASIVDRVRERALGDRSGEWFRPEMFPNIAHLYPDEPLIVRRALAFEAMLRAMTSAEASRTTGSFEIRDGELIVGVIPMGSVGLGKEFPRYLTETEERVAAFCHRDIESTFGHNSPDYARVLRGGLDAIRSYCADRLRSLEADLEAPLGGDGALHKKLAFYRAVDVCCRAVVDYARAFARLASEKAASEQDPVRREELLTISAICDKVPANPAETFHEALQSVYFVHLALHATLDMMSLGRLDQVLQPFLQRSLDRGELSVGAADELVACFLVKCGERLNLTSAWLDKQDHLDFGTSLGTSPVFLDQIASANNFLQNLVLGGIGPDGKDASNECTKIFLRAHQMAKLPTPTLDLRVHAGTPDSVKTLAAETLLTARQGLPILYNDEAIVPAFERAGIPSEFARDYVADGCWEPILNGVSDWTFGMVNMLTALECALNSGAQLSNNPSLLRGKKRSYATPPANELATFDDLQRALSLQIRFFVDQVVLGIYEFYNIDGSVTPTPFFSALLGDCLRRGIDKTWGGASYNLGGVIAIAVPNCANALLAIQDLVYARNVYSLPRVVAALKRNFAGEADMQRDFLRSPKYGNNDASVDGLAKWLLDEMDAAVAAAAALAESIFLTDPVDPKERLRIENLRNLVGYSGSSMQARFGQRFRIVFTRGAGTFGQYAFMGLGCAASADGRLADAPVAPNCSPASGTMVHGAGAVLASAGSLACDRFAAGLVVDLCLDPSGDANYVERVIEEVLRNRCNIVTVSIASREELQQAFDLCEQVRANTVPASALAPYAHLGVRVGGWNAPFISFTRAQQLDYLKRI